MTKTILATVAFATLTSASFAANTVYSGSALNNIHGSVAGDLTAGKLGLVILDVGNDGILGNIGGTTGGLPSTITQSSAGLDIGSTFGGDTIVNRVTSTALGGDGKMGGGWTWNLTLFPGTASTRFAVVWFEALTSANTGNAPANAKFGVASATTWVTPANDSVGALLTYTTAAVPTAAQIRGLTLSPGGTETVGDPANAAFATDGTTLTVVPEPSGAALGLLAGAGLLLRRRRN